MPSTSLNERIVVIGGSLAGARSVQALRREGHIGPLTVIGAETHWPPYDRPPLSKQILLGTLDPERTRLRLADELDVTVLSGQRAISLDLGHSLVALDDGSRVEFDRLIVATGAKARTLPGTEHLQGVHVLRTIDDSLRLRADLAQARRVAVVGAGFIGCEVASACRAMGIEVSLIDALPFPLAPLGDVIGAYLIQVVRQVGIDPHLGTSVAGLAGTNRVEGVYLADGDRISADVVVAGIGVTPATDWLESSGLTLEDGIVCDSACLALGADHRVAAAGDVARWDHPRAGSLRLEHWTNATEQANHAARALLHGPEWAGPFAPTPYFWSDLFGIKLQLVGICRPDHRVQVIEGSMSDNRFVATYSHNGIVDAVLCVNLPRRLAEWQARLTSPEPVPATS